jgi:hypothetical protein
MHACACDYQLSESRLECMLFKSRLFRQQTDQLIIPSEGFIDEVAHAARDGVTGILIS